MEKKALNMSLDELCEAMESNCYEHEYFLDRETGEILFTSDYVGDEETRELKDRIEEDFERYEQIPRAESEEGYEDMVDFIATVEDERLAGLLEVSINGKGAFRRFKDVLLNYPDERERWFTYKDDRREERAMDWLDEIGVTLAEE